MCNSKMVCTNTFTYMHCQPSVFLILSSHTTPCLLHEQQCLHCTLLSVHWSTPSLLALLLLLLLMMLLLTLLALLKQLTLQSMLLLVTTLEMTVLISFTCILQEARQCFKSQSAHQQMVMLMKHLIQLKQQSRMTELLPLLSQLAPLLLPLLALLKQLTLQSVLLLVPPLVAQSSTLCNAQLCLQPLMPRLIPLRITVLQAPSQSPTL